MIHIVEIHEHHHARVWFAFNEADFILKVGITHGPSQDMLIYQQTTARQLLADSGCATDSEALAAQYGWDTPLYRADYMLGQGIYQTEPVSELRACLAAVASADDFRVYPDDDTAADELDRDPFFKTKEGFDAYYKLRSQLVDMEVIAEDF